MKTILVCGGAGYVGSHMVKMLSQHGYEVITFDNLSSGHGVAVKWGKLVVGDILQPLTINRVFKQNKIDAVFHFGARSLVSESILHPDVYYRNNVIGTLNLLDAMKRAKVKNFIFSSTAAIFGEPDYTPIDEAHAKKPINPYGVTKLSVENILQDYAKSLDLNSVSLRYFNAAGADPSGVIGENHEPESHLIPNILNSLIKNKNSLKVFGDDYDTSDGTCIRDYIHVNDLCNAHLLALQFLKTHTGAFQFNLGNGKGFSILEVIKAAEVVTGQLIPYRIEARRPGDPALLIADSGLAQVQLGWQPQYSKLENILETAWRWHLYLSNSMLCGLSKTA